MHCPFMLHLCAATSNGERPPMTRYELAIQSLFLSYAEQFNKRALQQEFLQSVWTLRLPCIYSENIKLMQTINNQIGIFSKNNLIMLLFLLQFTGH